MVLDRQYCKFTILTIKFTVHQQQYFFSLKVLHFDTVTYILHFSLLNLPEVAHGRIKQLSDIEASRKNSCQNLAHFSSFILD